MTVLASLESTLAFYRRELTRLGWKEEAGAIVKADTDKTQVFSFWLGFFR